MANYLVAVSGGVDSVVLLDMLSKSEHSLTVAHVDHGIRGEDSAADARFVAVLAKRYQVPFVSTALHLGSNVSEETARDARYAFLFQEAKRLGATVVTAHHADDMVETVALNFTRGTGWRGLAVLGREDIARPLLDTPKRQLYDYAITNRLEWVEDATNREPKYLRNRLRAKLQASAVDTPALQQLRVRQLELRRAIDQEAAEILADATGSRYFLAMLDEAVAIELLGAAVQQAAGARPTRPQLVRALHAIQTARPGTVHQVGEGITLEFTARKYRVTML